MEHAIYIGGVEVESWISGFCLETYKPSFMLRHKEYPWIWLFTFGDKEERWKDFLNRIDEQRKEYAPKKSFWKKFFFWL